MADTGLLYATSVSQIDLGVGVAWSNPNNAIGNDAAYASALATGVSSDTKYLVGIFTHSIPVGATIDGITVAVNRGSFFATTVGIDLSIKLTKNGSIVGNEKSAGANWPSNTTAWSSDYGGAADLWGATWSATDTFGFAVAGDMTEKNDTMRVLAFRATIYYTAAAANETVTKLVGRQSLHMFRRERLTRY